MSNLERDIVLEARRRILAQVDGVPPKSLGDDEDEVVRDFVNLRGNDVRVTTEAGNEKDGVVSVDVVSRDFDPEAPYDPRHIYEYRVTYLLGADGEAFCDLARVVTNFPPGYTYVIDGVDVGEYKELTHVRDTSFFARLPVPVGTNTNEATEPLEVSSPTRDAVKLWSRARGRDRIAYALTAPHGISVMPVRVPEQPSAYLDTLIMDTVPDPNRQYGRAWNPQSAVDLGWDSAFKRFAAETAKMLHIDMDASLGRISDLVELSAGVVDLNDGLSYLTEAQLMHHESDRPAIEPVWVNNTERPTYPTRRAMGTPDELQVRRIVSALASKFRVPAEAAEALGIVRSRLHADHGPSLLVRLDDVVVRQQLAAPSHVYVVAAAQLHGVNTWRCVGPPVRNVGDIGALTVGIQSLGLENWRTRSLPDGASQLPSASGQPDWDRVRFDPKTVMQAVEADYSITVGTPVAVRTQNKEQQGGRSLEL